MKTAIVGASGYTGEELVRLLARHPHSQLSAVTSRSLAGERLVDHIQQLRGTSAEALRFSESDPQLIADSDVDTVFLALPHGVAADYAKALLRKGKRVIDLSADFRLQDTDRYQEFYHAPHPAPELLPDAVYVIPELAADGWQQKPLIACPGCYPTGILVPLIPLVASCLIDLNSIIINSYSGVSGGGKKVDQAFLYCERNESSKAYGLPKHRHLSEIEEQLSTVAEQQVIVQFTPHLAPMQRGIATTIVVKSDATIEAVYQAWQAQYAGKPFVTILPTGHCPDTAHVARTNRIDISAVKDPRTGNLILTSAEDNLLKGAGGQAVQIFNILNGWDETAGLI